MVTTEKECLLLKGNNSGDHLLERSSRNSKLCSLIQGV